MTDIETGTDHLLARIEDGVAVLTMNLPERLNALSEQMIGALASTLAQVEADDAVGAVVLTGTGGAFCAGGDVKGFAERSPGAPGAAAERRSRLLSTGTCSCSRSTTAASGTAITISSPTCCRPAY